MICEKCGKSGESTTVRSTICDTCLALEESSRKKENGVNGKNPDESHNKKEDETGAEMKTETKKEKIVKVVKGFVIAAIVIFLIWSKVSTTQNNIVVDEINSMMDKYNAGEITAQEFIPFLEESVEKNIDKENKIVLLQSLSNLYFSVESAPEKIISVNKKLLPLLEEDSLAYFIASGNNFLIEENLEEAKKSFLMAYEKDSQDYDANNALCLFYVDYTNSEEEKGVPFCKKAYELTNNHSDKINLGVSYVFANRNDEGLKLLTNVDFTQNPYIAYYVGLAYLQKEDNENAKKHFQIASDNGFDVGDEVREYLAEE